MKIKDLEDVLYNQRGEPLQTTVLWKFAYGKVDEYDSGAHEYIVNRYPDLEVRRIQAEIINGLACIVIETN